MIQTNSLKLSVKTTGQCESVQHESACAHTDRWERETFNQCLCPDKPTLIYIRCGVHALHNTLLDRFIIDSVPMLHIHSQLSICRMPVALNFHQEPLHLKMEVRSLSLWHVGSEKDQPALLKLFYSAALKHPSLPGVSWIWLFLPFAMVWTFVIATSNCCSPVKKKFNLRKSNWYFKQTSLSRE